MSVTSRRSPRKRIRIDYLLKRKLSFDKHRYKEYYDILIILFVCLRVVLSVFVGIDDVRKVVISALYTSSMKFCDINIIYR